VETGLVLMGFRYYDPASGRFLTKDPIGFAGGINQYAYVGNDPVNFMDPYGLLRIGPMDIPNGSIAGGLVTGGVMLAGGPVGWAIGGEFAIGAAWSYFADGNSLSTATAHGAMGAVAGVTAAEAIAAVPTIAAGWGLAGRGNGSAVCGVKGGSTAGPRTGSTLPTDLRQDLAIREAMSNPAAGIPIRIPMTDPRWPASDGWLKMQQIIRPGGDKINVHYVYNPRTGQVDDFKIKLR